MFSVCMQDRLYGGGVVVVLKSWEILSVCSIGRVRGGYSCCVEKLGNLEIFVQCMYVVQVGWGGCCVEKLGNIKCTYSYSQPSMCTYLNFSNLHQPPLVNNDRSLMDLFMIQLVVQHTVLQTLPTAFVNLHQDHLSLLYFSSPYPDCSQRE